MATLFTVKKGAQLPSIDMFLKSSAEYDLAQASAVTFVYQRKDETGRTTVPLVVTDAPNKKVRLDLGAGDVANEGTFSCQVEVVLAGKTMVFPQRGFDEFVVTSTIG
jgi:hypothetical protein